MLCLFDKALGFWSQQEEELEQVWQEQCRRGRQVQQWEVEWDRAPGPGKGCPALRILKKPRLFSQSSHCPHFPGSCLADKTKTQTVPAHVNGGPIVCLGLGQVTKQAGVPPFPTRVRACSGCCRQTEAQDSSPDLGG